VWSTWGTSGLPRPACWARHQTAGARELPLGRDLPTSRAIRVGVVHGVRSAVVSVSQCLHAAAFRREGSGPREGNSYAEVMGGSLRLECSTVRRRPSPPRNTKCASLGTRSPGVHRGSPDCICSRTNRLRSAAGYQTAGINLGNHIAYSARSRPSRSIGPPSQTVHTIRGASPWGASQRSWCGSVLAARHRAKRRCGGRPRRVTVGMKSSVAARSPVRTQR
jgi:hypothetical protein